MTDFVEECRREWKRLGVPDALAEEMAADLASDLADAEDDGVSAAELLGSSYSDPRAFASSWAAERGVVPVFHGATARRRPRLLVAFTVLTAIATIVAALLLATGEPKLAIVASGTKPVHLPGRPPAPFVPAHAARRVLPGDAAAPVEWILLVLAAVALAFAAWLWLSWSRSRPPAAAVR